MKRTIDNHRFPLAPHLDQLKAILAKLEPLPPLRPGMRPTHGQGWPQPRPVTVALTDDEAAALTDPR